MSFEILDVACNIPPQKQELPKWNQEETDYCNVHTIIEETKLMGTLFTKIKYQTQTGVFNIDI